MKMTLLATLATIALNMPTMAEEAIATKEFTFTVTGAELQTIASALQDQPFKQVAPIIDKLNKQFTAQLPKSPPDKALPGPAGK